MAGFDDPFDVELWNAPERNFEFEPISRIRARYMTGDEVTLTGCLTINAVRVAIADRHDKFAPDITVLSIDCADVYTEDDSAPPPKVTIVLNEEPYDKARWQAAVLAHAKEKDIGGLTRAMAQLEHSGPGTGESLFSKVLYLLVLEKADADANCVRVLIECGADIDLEHKYHQTTLIQCAKNDRPDLVQMLVSARANVDYTWKVGCSALMEAAQHGYTVVTQMLISARADIDHQCQYQGTALVLAASEGYTEVVQMLISARADVNHCNHYNCEGSTPLTFAVLRGDINIARMLISARAETNSYFKGDETALAHAIKYGHKEMAQMLTNAQSQEWPEPRFYEAEPNLAELTPNQL
eukprot:GEMP01044257.1.p1 GENE.GEMP01044257.1~~GEMP01044257.1.p1  ORF type:complete len:363 (+),score=58.57 GEMP01044257.1:28-1089(+)